MFLLIVPHAFAREVYNFNADWKQLVGDPHDAWEPSFDDSKWKPVTLPHAWNEDKAFAVAIHDLPTGIAWYRKHFVLSKDSVGKKVYLEFEGIRQGGEFFLNGSPIGRSDNGVSAFGFDVTDVVLPAPQENVLAARIDNAWTYREAKTNSTFEWNDRNFYANYGGINKNVRLHVTDKLHQTPPLFSSLGTTGVYIYADKFDIPNRRANITSESEVLNDADEPRTFRYEITIADMAGKMVKTFSGTETTLGPGESRVVLATSPVDGLNFWSWGYGYPVHIRSARALLIVDVQTCRCRSHANRIPQDRIRPRDAHAERSANPDTWLRAADDERMASDGELRAGVGKRLLERADGKRERELGAMDARDAVETGCGIVRPCRADGGDARRRFGARRDRAPMGSTR